jgi:3-phosphoshikimate 1-carboxyvinyltransferase
LTAVLAAGHGYFRIHGAPRMHERPLGALLEALRSQDVEMHCEERDGYPPLCILSHGLPGGIVTVRMDKSSQYLSGLLLAAPLCRGSMTIEIIGEKVVSWPYVKLTLYVLAQHGIAFALEQKSGDGWDAVDWHTYRPAIGRTFRITVAPSRYRAGDYTAEGDWSGAAAFIGAGLVGSLEVCVAGLMPDSMQADRAIFDILSGMGGDLSWADEGLIVRPSELHGATIDVGDCPDLLPVMAAVAAFAHGETRFVNAAHLRIKECDRLSASAEVLRRVGVSVEELPDGLVVRGLGRPPRVPQGMVFDTYNDHRMAMAAALFGLNGDTVIMDRPGVVDKSFPAFWELWGTLTDGKGSVFD